MIKKTLLLSFIQLLFYINAQTQDSIFFKKILGIGHTFIGKNITPKDSLKLEYSKYAFKKKMFSPFVFKYITGDNQLNQLFFANDAVYFNLDSLNIVSSVMVELSDVEKIINLITDTIGDITHKNVFRFGDSETIFKGWIRSDGCILIVDSTKLKLLIFYDCDKKELF